MSGQPVKTQADKNKKKNEYMESLALQEQINDMNLQANKTYLLSGQLPPQSQMQDTRTTSEKLKDVELMKQKIVGDFEGTIDASSVYALIQKIIDSPLNLNNSLFRFFAQRAASISEQYKKLYPIGIEGDANDVARIYEYIKNMYSDTQGKFQSTKSYMNSMSGGLSSKIIDANDMERIIIQLDELVKNITLLMSRTKNSNINTIYGRLIQTKNVILRLKNAMPDNESFSRIMQIINDPQTQRRDLGEYDFFLKTLEKLPKYNEVMALITKINQYIDSANYTTASDGIERLRNMFAILLDRETSDKLEEFSQKITLPLRREIYNETMIKEQQKQDVEKLQNEANSKIAKGAQKVYIVNPESDAVWVRNSNYMSNIDQIPTTDIGGFLNQPDNPTIADKEKNELWREENLKKIGNYPTVNIDEFLNPPEYNYTGYDPQYYDIGLNDINQYIPDIYNRLPNKEVIFNNIVNSLLSLGNRIPSLNQIKEVLRDVRPLNLTTDERLQLGQLLFENQSEDTYNELYDDPNYINLYRDIEQYLPHNDIENQTGLRRRRGRGRPLGYRKIRGGSIQEPKEDLRKKVNFIGFGINEIHQKQLDKGLVKIRRSTKSNYMDLPTRRVSSNLQGILKTIVGGGVPNYNDLGKLDDEEKAYLNKLITRSELTDRISVPAPSKDQQEKDIHNFEVMKGQIMSGNDSLELVRKFKLLIRKLAKQDLLPKADVDDLNDLLTDLGY